MEENGTRRIRVLIVDDKAAVREGIHILVESTNGMETFAQAGNGAEAIRLCAVEQPDVILMDLVMPTMDGLEATRRLRRIHPTLKIIMLTGYLNDTLSAAALAAGARRVMSKQVSASELTHAIRTTATAPAHDPGRVKANGTFNG